MKRHNGIKEHSCVTCGKAFVEPAGARNWLPPVELTEVMPGPGGPDSDWGGRYNYTGLINIWLREDFQIKMLAQI